MLEDLQPPPHYWLGMLIDIMMMYLQEMKNQKVNSFGNSKYYGNGFVNNKMEEIG